MVKSALIAIGVVTSIFLMFFVSLIHGISINNISLNNVNIYGLYLKYDKKLIFSIKKLKINKSDDKSEVKFEPNWLIYGNMALTYFKSIKIYDIDFEGEHLYVDYKTNIFNIKHKYLEFSLTQTIKNNKLKFNAYTNKITDIKFINKYINLNESVKKLINEQFTFDYIKLISLNGEKKLSNITKIDENDLNAKFIIKNPQLKYPNQPIINLNDIIITIINGNIDISISKSNIKSSVTFQGNIKTNIKNWKNGKITISGDLYYKDVIVNTNDIIKNGIISYQLSTNKFKDIKMFDKLIKIPKNIRKWAIVRLNSKSAKINNISGKIDLKKFNIDSLTLRFDATLDDVVMDFNPKRAYPLEAKKVQLLFDGKDMNIKLTKPKSNDVNLDGSDAVIYDMLDNSGIILNFRTISPINWTLVRILKSYNINTVDDFKVRQTKGLSNIKVKINIPFSNDPEDIFIKILNKNSTITVKDNPLKFNKFDFVYKDKKIIIKDTTLTQDENTIDINHLIFDIDKNKLDLDLNAHDINKTFSINLTNSSYLEQNNINGNINIDNLKFKDFIDIHKIDIPYNASFKDNINLHFPSLAIEYIKKGNTSFIDINSFKKLSKIIKVMKDNNITDGSAYIKTNDFLNIIIKLNLNIEQYGIFYKNKKQKDITLDMKIKKMKKISFRDTKNMLNGNIDITKKPKINLSFNDMGIEYKTKYLNEIEPIKKEPLKKCKNINFDLPQISLYMKNGYLKYNEKLINYEFINTKTNKNNIYFTLNKNNTNINLHLKGKQVYAKIDNLDSDFLNNISNERIADNGSINLSAYGTQCNINGKSNIKNLNIKDTSILNSIFLAISSAPAIINPLLIIPNVYRFATDKFKLSEYKIKKSTFNFDFNREKDILNIQKLNIFGVNFDFVGKADIDLYNKKIQSKLDVIFFKDYSKLISYIPLINNIVLDDNRRFSYSVDLDGNLTSPKVTTHIAKETVTAPINMIKRVFMLPLLPFMDSNTTK